MLRLLKSLRKSSVNAPEIDFDAVNAAAAEVAPNNVSSSVHPDDFMLRYMIKNRGLQEGTKAYFTGGKVDANKVINTMNRLGVPAKENVSMLEFASGFGRVTRHLKALLPEGASLTSSDIHAEACRFLNDQIGAPCLQSSYNPEEFQPSERFNFVFVLSLFSHLPEITFGRWLKALYDVLEPSGVILFTTHGEFALAKHPQFYGPIYESSKGFGFKAQSEQKDLDQDAYGSMIVSPEFVLGQIRAMTPDARLISFASGSWFGLQDEWAIMKPAI